MDLPYLLAIRSCPVQLSLVCRFTEAGVGHHYGVKLTYVFGDDEVVDLQAKEGMRLVTLEQFAAGKPVTAEHVQQDPAQVAAAWERLRSLAHNPPAYDFLQRNCEHIAREVIFGESKSPQIASAMAMAALLLILVALGGK